MSKQRRHQNERRPDVARAPAHEAHDVEPELGNQARQARLEEPAAFDVVRDAAHPLVDRAALALQIAPRAEAEVARFVEILERSRLPDERRAVLVDRIRTDRAVADGIAGAVRRWFGEDTPALRDALVRTLDQVAHALDGRAGEGAWLLPDGRAVSLAPDALEGGVSGRAEALVRDLAAELAAPGLAGPDVGGAVRGFCRDVQLALLWDEEEEEEEDFGGDYAAEESGA